MHITKHYYNKYPDVAHRYKRWQVMLRGMHFQFISDAGVFSKKQVDYGSHVLIHCMDIPQDATVLDVGCGYGPIGLTAARLAAQGQVTLVDINQRAIELAIENAKLNKIENVIIQASDGLDALTEIQYTVILTNPPIRAGKGVIYRMFKQCYEHLQAGGSLWVVIQKKQGAASAKEKLQQLFGQDHVERVMRDKGYHIYRAKK